MVLPKCPVTQWPLTNSLEYIWIRVLPGSMSHGAQVSENTAFPGPGPPRGIRGQCWAWLPVLIASIQRLPGCFGLGQAGVWVTGLLWESAVQDESRTARVPWLAPLDMSGPRIQITP